jgi:hypothetical protein
MRADRLAAQIAQQVLVRLAIGGARQVVGKASPRRRLVQRSRVLRRLYLFGALRDAPSDR